MQQPRQQRTYADLYSQRPASPLPVSQARDNLAANGSNGQASPDSSSSAAATKAKCKSPAPQNADEALQHDLGLTPAQQPSKIPACPGSPSPGLPSTGGASSKAAHHAAAVHSRIPSPTPAAATHRNGTGTQCSSSKEQLQAAVSPVKGAQAQHLCSARLADSSDWSQDSGTSSEASSGSPAHHIQHSSTQQGSSSIQGEPVAEQYRHSSSQLQQHDNGHDGVQHHSELLLQQGPPPLPQQQQDGSGFCPLLPDLQHEQQQHAVLMQQGQQQELLQCSKQRDPQQQQQRLLQAQGEQQQAQASGGPGPAGAAAAQQDLEGAAESAPNGSCAVRARMSVDPDYELPQGKLTETQVLLAHGSKLRLDRYGFILGESDMAGRTAGAATARRQRSASQIQREQGRVMKWRRMLGSSAPDFEAYCAAKMKKVKRRVRKGIPDEFRGYAWQLLSGGHALMQSHPGMYSRLVSHAPDAVDLEIMRDLNRTFPNHVFFHQRQGPGQQSLFHVLRAYSALDKQVGYVQGMGFVSAILLMYMSEEAAFWTLVALLKGTASQPPLEGLYQAGMPLLQQCLFQFHELLKQEHPRLGTHLEQEGVVPSMYCTHWFNTLLAYSLPFEHLLRVWDVFLLEGMKVVFRVGIALLASAQDQLCAMPFERLVAALNGRKFPILEKHPDVLMKAALRIPVSKQLEVLRERFLALQAETQAAAAGRSTPASAAAGDARTASAPAAAGHGRSSSSHSSKSSAAHAQQQLIAGLAPVPMGPNS